MKFEDDALFAGSDQGGAGRRRLRRYRPGGLSRVSLTTVARPREEWARRAVALLLARIEGEIADERVR